MLLNENRKKGHNVVKLTDFMLHYKYINIIWM